MIADGDNLPAHTRPSAQETLAAGDRLAGNRGVCFRGGTFDSPEHLVKEERIHALHLWDRDSQRFLYPLLTGSVILRYSERLDREPVVFTADAFRPYRVLYFSQPLSEATPEERQQYLHLRSLLFEQAPPGPGEPVESLPPLFVPQPAELYARLARLQQALVIPSLSRYWLVGVVDARAIFADDLFVIALGGWSIFAVLQSSVYELWARRQSGSHTLLAYDAAACFETFPFPAILPGDRQALDDLGLVYHDYRQRVMGASGLGAEALARHLHNPLQAGPDIARLRRLHAELDQAVIAAYDWRDLPARHDFYETPPGMCYTLPRETREEIWQRLLALNQSRYASETCMGLHAASPLPAA